MAAWSAARPLHSGCLYGGGRGGRTVGREGGRAAGCVLACVAANRKYECLVGEGGLGGDHGGRVSESMNMEAQTQAGIALLVFV